MIAIVLLGVLVTGDLVLMASPLVQTDSFTLVSEAGGIRYRTPGRPFRYSWYLSVACRPEHLDRIYVLTDPAIGTRFVGNRAVLQGLLDHLASYATALGWEPIIEGLTIAQMRDVLESEQPAVMIDPLGYWPASIPASSLRAWLEAGGVLVWLGDRLGQWLWTRRGPARADRPLDLALWGRSIYDAKAPNTAAFAPLLPEQNLGLSYWLALWGPSPAAVKDLGGRILGWQSVDGGRVSHAVVPVGSGSVVVFGYRLAHTARLERMAARDIGQILYRGLTDPGATVRAGFSDGRPVTGFEPVVPRCADERAVIGSPDPWVFRFAATRVRAASGE